MLCICLPTKPFYQTLQQPRRVSRSRFELSKVISWSVEGDVDNFIDLSQIGETIYSTVLNIYSKKLATSHCPLQLQLNLLV